MAQLVVRNLENAVKAKLQRRARQHGRSMEEEVREILRTAAEEGPAKEEGLGTAIARLFRDVDGHFEIPELRGFTMEPISFKK